jgi:predicted ester cyclase
LSASAFAQFDPRPRSEIEAKNKAIMLRFYEEVWDKGNVAVVDEVFAPYYLTHDSNARLSGGAESSEEQKKIVEGVRSLLSEYSFTPEYLVAEGDKVAARWTIKGKPKGLINLISADQFEVSGANIFRLADGKVVEIWNHRDDLGVQQQLGISKVQYALGFLTGLVLSGVIWQTRKLRRRLSVKRNPAAARV